MKKRRKLYCNRDQLKMKFDSSKIFMHELKSTVNYRATLKSI